MSVVVRLKDEEVEAILEAMRHFPSDVCCEECERCAAKYSARAKLERPFDAHDRQGPSEESPAK